ncbi:MAG: hypothetical protein ACKOAH_15565, partial [Pirellula sp.]
MKDPKGLEWSQGLIVRRVFLHNRNRLTNPRIFVANGTQECLFGVNITNGKLRTIDFSGVFMDE